MTENNILIHVLKTRMYRRMSWATLVSFHCSFCFSPYYYDSYEVAIIAKLKVVQVANFTFWLDSTLILFTMLYEKSNS